MIVLITNDDGFKSEGIKLLKDAALEFAKEVWIVAPDTDRSGTARAVTLKPISITQHAEKEFSVSGTPAECVIFALDKIMNKKPDLVLSGINLGSNVGDDILYSGTIGAAMEGAARSIPSIAFSQMYNNKIDWYNARTFTLKIITKLLAIKWPKNVVMNVNFPYKKEVQGIKIAAQGDYNVTSSTAFIENSNKSFSMNWYRKNISGSESVEEVNKGFITITPIKLDLTDYGTLKYMKKFF